MGYRSDVAFCLTKNGWNAFADKFNLSERVIAETVTELISNPDEYRSDKMSAAQMWFWTDIKWYPDYLDIGFMDSLMNYLDPDDFLFIRIGESSDDTEIQGAYWDNPFGLYLERNIQFVRPENGNR